MYLRLRIAAKPTEPIAGVEGFAPFVSPIWSLTRLSHEWYIGGGFCSSGSTEGTGGAILTKFRNVVIELRQGRRLFFAMPNKKSTLLLSHQFHQFIAAEAGVAPQNDLQIGRAHV